MAGLLRKLAVAICALAFAGCGIAKPPSVTGPRPGEGRVVLYLNGPASVPLQVAFEFTSVHGILDSGFRALIRSEPIAIDSLGVVERQILLAEAFLPQGRYRRLALGVAKARARVEGRWMDLTVPPDGFLLDVDFEVVQGQATALFMTWDVGRAIEKETAFRPAFGVEGPAHELPTVLAYVSNEGSDTVSVIDRSLDRVVAVLAVGRAPRGIVTAPDAARGFVVNSGSSTLSVIDINSDRVLHTTNLKGGAGASEVVIAADGRTLYVSNTALNSISAIDARNFQTIRDVAVGLAPTGLLVIPSRALLLVANGGENTLSLVDTSRNAVTATIPVDFQPANLAVDASGGLVFVPHLAVPRLVVLSLSTLRPVKTVTAGPSAAVLPDAEGGTSRVFVARTRERRVSLYDITLNAEIGSISVGDEPRYLALDPEREKMYVVNRGSATVTVVDRFSRRVRTTIQVGQRPYAIAMVR